MGARTSQSRDSSEGKKNQVATPILLQQPHLEMKELSYQQIDPASPCVSCRYNTWFLVHYSLHIQPPTFFDANFIAGFSFLFFFFCQQLCAEVSFCAAWLKSIICQARVRVLAGGRGVIWDKTPLLLGIGKGLRQRKLMHADDIGGCVCELYSIPSGMKRFVTDGAILFPRSAHECSPSCFPSLTDVGGGPRCTPLSFNWFGCLNPLGMMVGCDGGSADGGLAASCCVEPGKRAVEDSETYYMHTSAYIQT